MGITNLDSLELGGTMNVTGGIVAASATLTSGIVADTVALTNGVLLPEVSPTATVVAKTADYTVAAADFGKVITNTAAGGAITLTLPAASTVSGKVIRIAALAAQVINISPAATDGIFLNGSGVDNKDVVVAGVIGNSVTIRSNGTNYEAYNPNGVVTKEG